MCVSYCGHFKIRVGTVPLEIIATLNAVFPQQLDAVLLQIGWGMTAKGTRHGCGKDAPSFAAAQWTRSYFKRLLFLLFYIKLLLLY